MRISRLAAIFAAFMLSGLTAIPAHAQYVCANGPGPGERQVGTTGGGGGMVGMPLCTSDGSFEGSGDAEGSETVRMPDPLAGRINAATTIFELQARNYDQLQQRLRTDPAFAAEYRRYMDGGWDHTRDSRNRAAGQGCAALFSRGGNMIQLLGPNEYVTGALLVLIGKDVPAPEKLREINVSLMQTGDTAPQTVKAYNYRVPDSDLGAVALGVPGIDPLLDNMLDRQGFEVKYRNRKIFAAEWTGGLSAREALARCVHGGN
ncbi:MAG: hypothetical protein H6916_03785 [Novosphingobium sp.]|uniref:hypothetical protein n=1 Tax=Novosphingobium sp. TaxID=1874826 RepID=UPI001D40162F|nr:hypothetical protein [Novosphingobium sp.]MCB2056667.1 hypothetical protein [Novosphingobium sp.]MCP5385922.1 hypothetical protein [Novosphingobium sp.]